MGTDPPRQAHRQPHARASRSSCRWPSSTTSCSAAGTSSPTTPTRRRSKAGVLQQRAPRARSRPFLRDDQAEAGGLRPELRQEAQRRRTSRRARPRRDLAEQVIGRHRALQEGARASTRLVMVWCGSTEVYREAGRGPLDAREVREGPRGERPRHPALDDLRLRRASRRASPTPTARPTCPADIPALHRAGQEDRRRRSAARTSRPARR